MNRWILFTMCLDKGIRENFLRLHKKFSASGKYKLRNMVKCGWNAVKHDRIARHEKLYVLNSFIPPLNSPAFFRMAARVPGEGADFFENHMKGRRLAPISAYIAATGRCMYACRHCSADSSPAGGELSTAAMLEIVGKLQDLGVAILGFTGGEPLLRDDLEEIIASIDREKSVSFVFTTGFGLTLARAAALKAAGLFGVAISLDSADREAHDGMRGVKGAYNHALSAVRNAKKAGLYTMTQTVCTREMLANGGIFALADMLKRENVDEMRILEPLPCGRLSGRPGELLSADEQKQLKNLHIILNHGRQYPKASVFPYFESAEQFGCGAGSQHSYVDKAGNFGPCDFLNVRYGNLLTEEAAAVWDRMHGEMGAPKCACFAKNGGPESCGLPAFYRLLGGTDG